jgi:hypothetical protein
MARISLRSCIWLVESDLLPHVLIADEEIHVIAAETTPAEASSCDSKDSLPAPPAEKKR